VDVSGWDLELLALYGRAWAERARFHLSEQLYESPAGGWAVLRGKEAPHLLYHSGRRLFWLEGQPGEPVEFSSDGCRAQVWEFTQSLWRPRALGCQRRVLDCELGRLLEV
jgi:hypothetical protein